MPPPASRSSSATPSTSPRGWNRRPPPTRSCSDPPTYALVRDHVVTDPTEPLELKGLAGRVVAQRLVAMGEGPDAPGARPDPPLVGREPELATLRTAFDRAVRERSCELVTVLGSAGVGKSRLAKEFLLSTGPAALIARARCLPYGDGITFWPVAELVKQLSDVRDDEDRDEAIAKIERSLTGCEDAALITERVAAVTGFTTSTAGLQETFWAIRRFLEWTGRDRPMVVILDDLQWAEPTFLDLIEYLAGWSRGVAMLLLCLGRPDLMDLRPTWGSGVANASVLPLGPLGELESARLVSSSSVGRRSTIGCSLGSPSRPGGTRSSWKRCSGCWRTMGSCGGTAPGWSPMSSSISSGSPTRSTPCSAPGSTASRRRSGW